ncbi:MAG: hypothetical protein PHX37_01235 [Eubacteriales bacterium]|nr:hypothetical protein [Eubacteriales bacterium]
MNKKQAILLGVGGAVATAAVIGGAALLNGRPGVEPANQSSVNDTSYQSESSASSEMEQYLEQIRSYDEEKQKLLNSTIFYQGNATIQETYKAVSGMEGDTPVTGSAAMVSEDIVAYDERTDKCYLVARRISLLGDGIKDYSYLDIYSGTATVKVCGILTEYYGNGILKAYDVADALGGKKGYYLDFSTNPVRFDCSTEIIYTNPPVKKTYWVQIIGPTEISLVDTGVFTPEELPYGEVGLMPGLPHLFNEKTYNSSQTLIYEKTGGKWAPQGTFMFDYKKMAYDEVKDFLDELKTEAQKDKQLEDAAEKLSDAWKDALEAEREMETIIDASDGIKSYVDCFSVESSADARDAINEAEMLVNSSEFNGEVIRANESLDNMESSGGSLRKLEDFSLDGGGGGEQQEAAEAMGSLLPVLREYMSVYREAIAEVQNNTGKLGMAIKGKTELEEDARLILEKIREGASELERLSVCLEQLCTDFSEVLLSYDQGKGIDDTEYAALERLCGLWENTLQESISGTGPIVDIEDGIAIPDDYPSDIVPLPKDAAAVIYEKDTDGTIMLTVKTNMTQADAIGYYEAAFSGEPGISSFSMGDMWTMNGNKENFELSMLISENLFGGSEPTMIQITLIPE